jgi:hypothetical protein
LFPLNGAIGGVEVQTPVDVPVLVVEVVVVTEEEAEVPGVPAWTDLRAKAS